MKVVINKCYGGFGLSQEAYKKLIEWGIPVVKYKKEKRDPNTGLIIKNPAHKGEIIFQGGSFMGKEYWECWTSNNRTHPLIIRVVEELGLRANGKCAELAVVEIPDRIEWEIDEYDGIEHIAESHRTWA